MKTRNLVPLGDFIEQIRGVSYKPSEIRTKSEEDYLPILRASNFDEEGLNTKGLIYIHKSRINENQLIKAGDILIASSSGSKEVVGKSIQFKEDFHGSFGAFCKLIRVKQGFATGYVGHFFKSKVYKNAIRKSVQGANINNLRNEHIDSLQIPRPSIADQIRIDNILSRAELLIHQRKESLRLLDEFLKSTFLEMFGDPVKNETDRNTKPLGERIRVKHGFAFQSKYFSSSGKYVLLTPGNFREEGGYRDRGDKQKFYIGEIPKKYVLKKGDLLVAMTEQAPGLLGSPIIIPESNKFLHNQRLGLLEFDRKYFNTHFLFYLFNTLSIRRIIHAKATGTKVRHTSPKKLEEIAIQYPPLELQNDFAAIVQKVQALKASNETSLSMLESLFKSLSSKAFKGQLDLKVESGKAESKGVHLYS